jgi:hypothetical protein
MALARVNLDRSFRVLCMSVSLGKVTACWSRLRSSLLCTVASAHRKAARSSRSRPLGSCRHSLARGLRVLALATDGVGTRIAGGPRTRS